MRSSFDRAVSAAIERGVDALLDLQGGDGFWREFDLKPGPSVAWATGWVGWCLMGAAPSLIDRRFRVREACRRASAALLRTGMAGGWGYSLQTGPDADTCAWVLRFLASCGYRIDPRAYLDRYIDPGGGVHTFLEPSYGAWTHAHDDVAANVGLALAEMEVGQSWCGRAIRERLESRFPGETYWWSTPEYGVAWTLRCFARSGGVPDRVRALASDWIASRPRPSTAFETVHRLIALQSLAVADEVGAVLVNDLLDLAGAAGWPGGAYLLVPPMDDGPPSPPNEELHGLLTTSLCVRALSEWQAQRNRAPSLVMA
jgi:hypothetical protein